MRLELDRNESWSIPLVARGARTERAYYGQGLFRRLHASEASQREAKNAPCGALP
jgi:hypothetical protein